MAFAVGELIPFAKVMTYGWTKFVPLSEDQFAIRQTFNAIFAVSNKIQNYAALQRHSICYIASAHAIL